MNGGSTRLLTEPRWWFVLLATLVLTLVTWPSIDALRTEGRDLQQDYVAVGRIGSDLDIYDPVTPDELHDMGVGGEGIPVNAHPPTSLILFTPFRILDFSTTAIVWSIASILALTAAVWLAARQAGKPWLFWGVFALGWWYPLTFHLRFGQWSTFILLATVLTWIGVEEDRPALAGIPVALLGAVKVLPAALVVVPLWHRQWRAVAWAVGSGMALLASAQLLAPGALGTFLGLTSRTDDAVRGAFGNGSLFGLISRTFGGTTWIEPVIDAPQVIDGLRYGAIAIVVVLTFLALGRTRDIGLQISVVTMAVLLVSPVTWRHADVILLCPAIVLVGRHLPRRVLALTLLGAAALLTLVDHWTFTRANIDAGRITPLAWTAELRSPGAAILLLVFAACLVSCRWGARARS